MIYRNTRVDLATPRNRLDYTAQVIYGLLIHGPEYVANVDHAIMAHPRASLSLKSQAMKAMRNIGYPVGTVTAGRHTLYRMCDPAELEEYSLQQTRQMYSQYITMTRAAAGVVAAHPTDAQAQATHQFNLQLAIATGARLGIAIGAVVREAVPL